MESVVKLVALLTVGLAVVFLIFDGPVDLWTKASDSLLVGSALNYETRLRGGFC